MHATAGLRIKSPLSNLNPKILPRKAPHAPLNNLLPPLLPASHPPPRFITIKSDVHGEHDSEEDGVAVVAYETLGEGLTLCRGMGGEGVGGPGCCYSYSVHGRAEGCVISCT